MAEGLKRVLLISVPSREVYAKAKVKVAVPERPSLTYATLAAPLLQRGHEVKVLDLDLEERPGEALVRNLELYQPDFVGMTCTTPLYDKAKGIASVCKNHDPQTVVATGGPHPTCFPERILADSEIDMVCIGEGDHTIVEMVSDAEWSTIQGIWYKKDGKIVANQPRGYIRDLDILPYPAWDIFDLKKYKTPRLSCRKNPVGGIETSRGCVYDCTYCNKNIFGRTFRVKSPQRVVDEMEYMLTKGFQEIHVMDDGFTTDLNRAKKICDHIKERGLDFPWNLANGIRVDRTDKEFLEKVHAAGCYRVTFGVESGDQILLNNINKGITVEQVRQVFRWCKEVGIESMAYFMFGLPRETEETMQKTIDLAKELDPDFAKVSITLPLPGTPLYIEMDRKGYIKSYDWNQYNQQDPAAVYDHPNITWETMRRYYKLFYRQFYLRPRYIWKRLKTDILKADLLYDFLYMLKTEW